MTTCRPHALAGVTLGVCLFTGCAARPIDGLSGRFVRAGEPQVEVGTGLGPPSLESHIGAVRQAAASATPVASVGLTIESRDPDLAAALLEIAVRPGAGAHVRAAQAYRRLQISDAAFSHTGRALRYDARHGAAYELRAQLWRDWGFPQAGIPDAYRATYFAPASASAFNTYGTLLQAAGRRGEARRAYERALALDPAAAYVLNNLCYLAYQEGDLRSAVERCRAALDADPALKAARNNLALAYAAAGRMDLAARQFRQAAGPAAAHYNAGLVHMARGDYTDAARAFEEARRLDPDLKDAFARMKRADELAARAARGHQ